jgi:hypothetical protein
MYGMVNNAIEGMVTERFGAETWEKILKESGVNVDVFISNEGYPDAMTYQLVGAASKVLNLPAEAVLEAFGEYWILETGRKGYGELMTTAGATLEEFLLNLPNFHTRIVLMMPNLKPPRFEYSDRGPTSLVMHHHTEREGLAAFAVGLLKGLAKMFETPVTVTQVLFRGKGSDHDAFRIEWPAAAGGGKPNAKDAQAA